MSINFDVAPYYDDTASAGGAIDNNYMRILFRPGYAVQARELTALQSILQNQISQISGFVFADGSPVTGGHISLDTTVTAIQLQQQYNGSDISLSSFLVGGNSTLVLDVTNSNAKAVVVATDSTQANPVILVKYLTAATFQPGDVIQVATGLQTQAQLVTANASNPATVASITPGIFFSGGFFVDVPAQTISVDPTTAHTNSLIGLAISENIIDENTDSALLDPAQGSFNYQAPGATRYQYSLSLASRTITSTDLSAFYPLVTVQNGVVTQQIDYPVFADLDKALAQRTYDTSGDFTVKPFVVSVADNAANTAQCSVIIEPGKAYVKGFEFETVGTQRLFTPKARTTNTITQYGMSLDYGNYVIANNLYGGNVSGQFDITNLQSIDLHCVSSGNINVANATAYSHTLMGTARVRDIEFLGLNNYYVYLTSINVSSINFTAASGGSNTVTFPGTYVSVAANAYANVTVSVNTAGVVDTRSIITYYTANQTAVLSAPLTIPANATSNVTLIFGIQNMGSGVVSPNTFPGGNLFATQATSINSYACFDISSGGKDSKGNTILNDKGLNRMVYPLPQNYVAQNTIANASFECRKNVWSQQFTVANGYASATISSGSGLGAGESFPYGYSGSNLPDLVANNNFLIIVRNGLSSGFTNGEVVIFNQISGNYVHQTDTTHVTVVTSASSAFYGDIIFTAQVTNAASAAVARRTKTLIGNTSNNFLLSTDSLTNAAQVIGSAPANTVYIDAANGYVWFTSNTAVTSTPGGKQVLYVPDVINIIKIYDSGNTAFAPSNANAANLIDITSNYYLDSGQRDNHYDFGALILKPGSNPPTGQTVVFIQYFQPDTISSVVQGFFDVDSYSPSVYAAGLIPYYQSQNFGTLALRDSIDFRPVRTIGISANVTVTNFNGLLTPYPDASFLTDFGYYLSRVDKLMLSKDKNFRISYGTPAQYPVPPADADDAMTLYIITMPAYTGNVYQIQLQYVEHKRYTMQDIGTLDTRIQALELQSTLTALETQASQEQILYSDGITAKDQYGIIADDFSSFSVCDNQNPDLRCYMAQGSLTPYKHQQTFHLNFLSNTAPYANSGKCYTLPYTETPAVIQNTASVPVAVQPFLFGQFAGTAKLTPQTSVKYSSEIAPQIIAPPSSTAPDQPPAPPANSAPALSNGAPVQAVTTVAGSLMQYNALNYYWDYWDYRNGTRYYIRIPRTVVGYGAINPFYNWFGTLKAQTTTAPAATTIPNSGSAIQLASGASTNAAVQSVQSLGALHLFGQS